MAKKTDYSKKIVKILSEKPAVLLNDIANHFTPEIGAKYAVTRSLKSLEESGSIEHISSDHNTYIRLTQAGKKKAMSFKLESDESLVSTTWDGYWRVILLDIPETRKNEREALRYLLKKAGFMCLKNSAWISPYPFEHMFGNIKKDLMLTTELMIFMTNTVDDVTEKELRSLFTDSR